MKTLYLVRHAKSSWKDVDLRDMDRPLNKRGYRDAPDMGSRLQKKGILPDLMLSSPAKRAMTTCQIIAQTIGYPEKQIQVDTNVYHAGPVELLALVKNIDDDIDSLMLFGHNPGFTDFANRLTRTDIWNIPTCGIFACCFDVNRWNDVSPGLGEKLWYDYPKNKQSG